jgi:hypothetical protein
MQLLFTDGATRPRRWSALRSLVITLCVVYTFASLAFKLVSLLRGAP